MSVTIGFTTNVGGANPAYFILAIPKDNATYKVSDRIKSATGGDGKSVNVPNDFRIDSLQLNSPSQLSTNGTVVLDYPSGSGSNRTTKTLTRDNNTAQITVVISELIIKASS